jgi:hypothetical protein
MSRKSRDRIATGTQVPKRGPASKDMTTHHASKASGPRREVLLRKLTNCKPQERDGIRQYLASQGTAYAKSVLKDLEGRWAVNDRNKMPVYSADQAEHLRHMTDGHWHDRCPYCVARRSEGGTGLPERTPAQQALAEVSVITAEARREAGIYDAWAQNCHCEFADVGVGPLMKVAEQPDCPVCTEFGYALWALAHGTPHEKAAAAAYLDEMGMGRD